MRTIKFVGFLALSVVLVNTQALSQRANANKGRSAGLTTTNVSLKTIAPTITYQTGTSRPASTEGKNNTYVGFTDIDFDKIDARCKNLVGQALKSYCLENECSEQSNTYMVSQALPLDKTIQVLSTYIYGSPSTSVKDQWAGQVYVYNNSVTTMCQPYLVNLVEAYLPAFYGTTTSACQDQYASSIDLYCKNNQGCYNMKNFQILEYMKANNTQDFMQSITNTNDGTYNKYFFTDYCLNKLSDKSRISLINLYMPDYKEYQTGLCKRAYANAIGDYCLDEGCLEELTLNSVLKDRMFNRSVRALNDNIDCNKELTQDVRDTLLEQIILTGNQCLREGGIYNASRNECQWKIAIYDDSNNKIDEKLFNEGDTVSCSKDTFIDPFSKEGRERADKGWAQTQEAARILATSTSAVAGGIAGGFIGDKIGDDKWLDEQIKVALENGWDNGNYGAENKKITFIQKSGDIYTGINTNGNLTENLELDAAEYNIYKSRKQAITDITKNQKNLIKNILKNTKLSYTQMVYQIEEKLWGTHICGEGLTCSAAILVRNTYQSKLEKITQITLEAIAEKAKCKVTLIIPAGTNRSFETPEACPTDLVGADKAAAAAAEIAAMIERSDLADKAQIAERIKLATFTGDNPSFKVTSNTAITTNIFIIKLDKMLGGKATGAAIGATVGTIGLGAAAFGITELAYKLKYDKVACYSILDAKNDEAKIKKIKKANWKKSFTLPKIITK